MTLTRLTILCCIIVFSHNAAFSQYEPAIMYSPGTSNFAYPQSVYIDSQSGHIWVSDFDHNRILRFDIPDLTSVNEQYNTPLPQFNLHQNYPNPFNSETSISFSTSVSGKTVLSIYDILGQKIITVFNQEVTAGKQFVIKFNASFLSGGVYFYTLTTPGGVLTKTMCLLK